MSASACGPTRGHVSTNALCDAVAGASGSEADAADAEQALSVSMAALSKRLILEIARRLVVNNACPAGSFRKPPLLLLHRAMIRRHRVDYICSRDSEKTYTHTTHAHGPDIESNATISKHV